MNAVTLRAHFDGEQIRLDEPYDLPPDVLLLVTVLPPEMNDTDEDREEWMRLAEQAFAAGYDADEAEYPLSLIKEWNPEYDGR